MRNLPGPKPKCKVKIEWSQNFAYAIGLITTDGCLSKDGRHIDFTSKDKEQIDNYMKALNILYPHADPDLERCDQKNFNGTLLLRTYYFM